MTTRGQDIVSVIKKQIEQFGVSVSMVDVGTVIEIGDGIARIHGLADAKYSELLQFPNEVMGIALNLEEDSVAAVVLGDYTKIKEGDEVRCTGLIAEVPVGDADISCLRYAFCGAAPLSVELFKRFEAHSGMKILEGYGLTEGTLVSSLNPLHGERKVGSVGLRIPYQEMQVFVDDTDGWRPAETDEIGLTRFRQDRPGRWMIRVDHELPYSDGDYFGQERLISTLILINGAE